MACRRSSLECLRRPEPACRGALLFLALRRGRARRLRRFSTPLQRFRGRHCSRRRRRRPRSGQHLLRRWHRCDVNAGACWRSQVHAVAPESRNRTRCWLCLRRGPRLRRHPAAVDFATLCDEGKVSVFPAIGYDDPNQSHFTSRHFYEIGETTIGPRTGWLVRDVDLAGSLDNPLQGLSLDSRLAFTDLWRAPPCRSPRSGRPVISASGHPESKTR